MARTAVHSRETFFDQALALVARDGPAAATTAAILKATGATVGSFYHRFPSRDALMAELWMTLVEDYQRQFRQLLDAGDAVEAALFTPRWVRAHPREARILLLHRREAFIDKKWPPEFNRRARRLGVELETAIRDFSRRTLGTTSAEALGRVRFALIEVPLASVKRALAAGEPIAPLADELVRECCQALLARRRSTDE